MAVLDVIHHNNQCMWTAGCAGDTHNATALLPAFNTVLSSTSCGYISW